MNKMPSIPSIPNTGLGDKNLSRRFGKLSEASQYVIKNNLKVNEINSKNIGELDETKRKELKVQLTAQETKEATAKSNETKAAADKVVTDTKDQGMGEDELEGNHRLIFIGTGSGGSPDRNQYDKNLIDMKNSTYYAATKEEGVIKEITSKTNTVGPVEGKVNELITLTKQAIIKTDLVTLEFRNRLTNTLSSELSALLPDGVKKLKFANKVLQSLQIVLGYDRNDEGFINGKGRMQFVPRVGNPVSTAIIIENSKYKFDDKALLSNKEAGKTFKEVADKLGLKLDEQVKTDGADGAADVPNYPPPPIPGADGVGGKKRKTYRKKNMSKAKRSKVAKKTRKAYKKMKHTKR